MELSDSASTTLTSTATTPGLARNLMEVSVASAIFSLHNSTLCVLAIRPSVRTAWTLPRYNFQSGMGLADAATLAIKQIANLPVHEFFQVGAVSAPDAAASTIEVGFLAATWAPSNVVSLTEEAFKMGVEAKWLPIADVALMVPSAKELVETAAHELRRRTRFDRIIFSLLPSEFSLSELQKAFEVVIGRNIDVRNFRKKMEAMKILEESAHKPRGMAHRPPRLFSFSPKLYSHLLQRDPEVRFF
jgi:ADP-ribose pyrophosphatase YjhB (NUDIX family)